MVKDLRLVTLKRSWIKMKNGHQLVLDCMKPSQYQNIRIVQLDAYSIGLRSNGNIYKETKTGTTMLYLISGHIIHNIYLVIGNWVANMYTLKEK